MRVPEKLTHLRGEETFDPKVHLELTEPERVWSLADFGYGEKFIAKAHFPLAVTAPFRILSDRGVAALRQSVAALSDARASDRMAKFMRGTVYRSHFIRDLCNSPEVTEFIGKLAGAPVLSHPMPLYQGHINLKPEEEGRDVDRWHTDTVVLDYVLLLTDREAFEGGHFEYLQCTKQQAIRHLIREEEEPHLVQVDFPKAGYAVLQQGNLVVHRGASVTKGDERTTLVQSFVPDTPNYADISKLVDCKLVDDPDVLYTEWARYKAFLAQRRLTQFIEEVPFSDDTGMLCQSLRRAIRDIEEAVLELSDSSEGRLVHYGQDALTDHL